MHAQDSAYVLPRCIVLAADWERRWTVFSTFWYLVKQAYFKAIPPALRYVAYLIWYPVQMKLYETHKAVVMLRE